MTPSAATAREGGPMRAKGLTPKPSMLPKSYEWCDRCATGGPKGWVCQICGINPRYRSRETPTAEKVTSPKPRPGQDAEDGLARQLKIAGFTDFGTIDPATSPYASLMFVRGFAFGLYLVPRRGFAADFAFPAHRLLVEVDGGAHYATKRQGQHDTERRGLAASIGWTILPVTPEAVRDGSAVELVKQAIDAATRGGRSE